MRRPTLGFIFGIGVGACALIAPSCGGSLIRDPGPDAAIPDTSSDLGTGDVVVADLPDVQDVVTGEIAQTGQIVDYSSLKGLVGITVSSGTTQTTTTDTSGDYTLTVAQNQPFTMTSGGSGNYATLDEQEWILGGSANRGPTKLITNSTFNLLKSLLVPAPDSTLALLFVVVQKTGACASTTGAKLSAPGLTTDGGVGPKLEYFSGGFPSSIATSVTEGQTPSAILWDLPVGIFSQIIVTPPSGCTLKGFPITDPAVPNLTYTGNVKLEGSQTTWSSMRVFLQ